MDIKRKKFQGVLNILSFNRHFYILGLIALGAIVTIWTLMSLPNSLLWLIIIAFIYGLIVPLIVSAYVYDYSGYYNFDWLNKLKTYNSKNTQIVNINAGFDETSFILNNKFNNTKLQVFDFYDQKKHTEAAIVRARKVSLVYPNTKLIETNKIPLEDKSTDVIFLLSAAHEIRVHKERVQFLKECHRICKPNGKVIMVEHLRDVPNFLAFSIGFTHFFSRKRWIKSFEEAGFSSINETKFTPFMSIFDCYK